MDKELSKQLDFAMELAREAGEIILDGYRRPVDVKYKGEIDLLTATDQASEAHIIERIRREWPEDSILAEEAGAQPGQGERRWFVDPLDGTTNFAHKYPYFCVSLGLAEKDRMILGVVYDPIRKELFAAARDGGATLNGERIKVSREKQLARSLLATGFPYDRQERKKQVTHFKNYIDVSQAVRRDGAAALDLAYLACGRFDGFWEHSLHPWDTAAGIVIVQEAGGQVTDFSGGEFNPLLVEIIASNGHIHAQMLDVIRQGLRNQEAGDG